MCGHGCFVHGCHRDLRQNQLRAVPEELAALPFPAQPLSEREKQMLKM
eukprot:COSAG06_NODE_58729_length_276_cov_0.672316_1_plen_47_part_01